ncbi:hypothetical protein FS749_006523 [Ceratobasidium sp. UAMH 11750]|nr:hypothetical protein FS749_006523 [Ceratobasidium sp. UAMH 11750]
MSHNYMSSGSSTPGSSHHSDQRHDSDTTPSPSDYRSPTFDPQAVSAKLALYEASQSLSVAAETLASAAQAMSKAAASLALASGNHTTKKSYEKRRAAMDRFGLGDISPDSGSWSPVWQQNSYVLSGNNKAPGNHSADRVTEKRLEFSTNAQINKAPLFNHGSTPDSAHRENDIANRHVRTTTVFESTTAPMQADGDVLVTRPPVTEGPTTDENKHTNCQDTDVIDVELDSQLDDQPSAPIAKPSTHINTTTHDTVIDLTSPIEPEPIHAEPTLFDMTIEPKSRFTLAHASDELAAVAFLCQQYPKVVCFYRYWDAAWSLVNTLKSIVGCPVIAPASLKIKQVSTTIAEFLEQPKSVLLWPSNSVLPEIPMLAQKPDVLVIHIGHLSTYNNRVNFTRVLVVTNEKLLSSMPAKRRNKIQQEYPMSIFNDSWNERGDTSILHPYRLALRASLAGEVLASSMYKAFISYHRTSNPTWTAHELADRADEYARDYLLRGDSKNFGEMVGARIRLKQAEVTKWALEPAVYSGAILVET